MHINNGLKIKKLKEIIFLSIFGLVILFFYIKYKIELPIKTKLIIKPRNNIIKRLQYIILDGLRYDKFISFLPKLNLPPNSAYFRSITETPTITVPRLVTMFSGRKYKILDCLNVSKHKREYSDSIFDLINCDLFGDTTLNDLFGVNSILKNNPYLPNNETEEEILKYLLKYSPEGNRIIHLNVMDKIGHQFGIFSKEYNCILKRYINFLNKYITNNPESLIIITSDHGCLDNGDHGGISMNERSSMFCIIDKTINFNIWPLNGIDIQQIDILPTICDILGIDSPTNSRGLSLLKQY